MSNKPTGVAGLTLTPAKESILKELKEGKLTGNEIAEKYHVSPSYVSRLKPKEPKKKKEAMKANIKKLTPMKKSKMEEESIEMAKAKKAKELYKAMEVKKKEDGFRWITRVGKHGIKETVFIKQ